MLTLIARSHALRRSVTHSQVPPLKHKSFIVSIKRQSSSLPAAYVEDVSKGPMLRFQESLPRLPVPTLEETASRYLKSLRPIISSNEYKASKAAVEDFIRPGGVGHELQAKLLKRKNDPAIKNWIYEWWNQDVYYSYRGPVVPYLSYFFAHQDDPLRRNPSARAAAISSAVLEVKDLVDNGSIEPEYMKKLPICMDVYKWMFNATRIPSCPTDYPLKFCANKNQHLVAIRRNQFFKIPHHIDGQRLNASELQQQFDKVYKLTDGKAPAVGSLTSESRDVWANARRLLAQSSSKNEAALHAIDSASFVVCLDDASPVTIEERSRLFWHGDGANRWYDKPLQFIIANNGVSGFMGEHLMMDGTSPHRLNDLINDLIFNKKINLSSRSIRAGIPDPELLPFEVNEEVQAEIDRALMDFQEAVNQHELTVQTYQGYGKDLIKRFKCSPDAYAQMIIQLAYFKMFGECRPTYESAATRRFQLGRTETCRTVSSESVAWCESMLDSSRSNTERIRLLRNAINAHVEYVVAASDGKGVDRHLFGLRKLLTVDEEVPKIYTDPGFSYSSTWYLSTSQLTSEYYNGFGYSQAVDEGFGIAYMIKKNSMLFNVVSKGLGTDRMSHYLNEAAEEMRDLMLHTISDIPKL